MMHKEIQQKKIMRQALKIIKGKKLPNIQMNMNQLNPNNLQR